MSTSNGYSAAYDATGNLICRAPTSSTTCDGTQTGQQLSYDLEGRLTNWQNQPTSPTSTVNYLYDGSGNRVAMQATVNGTTTTTAYIGDIEEVQTTGSSTQTTTYYTIGGQRIAANVSGTFYYFGYDVLGSQVVVLNGNGILVGSQLYGPYGNQRYSNGTLPTSIGFTGQRTDSVTGLDYYGARYYDPVTGVFLSPDDVQGNQQGMDPYMYVSGDPETRTDPTGHCGFSSWGDFGSCFTQAGQAIAQDTGTIGSDIGGFFDGVAEAVGGFLADWGGPIAIGANIAWWLSHPQQTACGCVSPSTQSQAASTTIADAQSIAGSMSRPRAWDEGEQRSLAKDLSNDATKARAAAIARYKPGKGKNPGKATGAEGLLTISVGGNTIIYPPYFALGFQGADLNEHAEQLIVTWAEGVIRGFKGSLQGAVINLLIFTQNQPCSYAGGCAEKLSSGTWLNTLYAATGLSGGQAEVNLDVWQPDPDPSNISGVKSYCTGSTDGITSTNNC